MTFLPIVDRELRIASRRAATYWSRLIGAFLAIFVGSIILQAKSGDHPSTLGPSLFKGLSLLVVVYCGIIGMFLSSDCLSEEKESGTLGLLFLTDLKGEHVVLGKLVARTLLALFFMLAVFPVLAFSLPLGGVTRDEFYRGCTAGVATLFFSLSLGIFSSSICRTDRGSLALSGFLLILFSGIFPLLGSWWHGWGHPGIPALFSPGYGLYLVEESSYGAHPGDFWMAMAILLLLGMAGLWAAIRIVPTSWQEKGCRKDRKDLAPSALRLRRQLLTRNPYLGRIIRSRWQDAWGWLLVGAFALIYNRVYMLDQDHEPAFFLVWLPLHFAFKVWMAYAASRYFLEDKASGAFELILCTPLQVRELIQGYFLALRRQFFGPVLLVLLIDWLFLVHQEDRFARFLILSLMATFLLDLVALAWVGMWAGLAKRQGKWAAFFALWRISFLPSAICVLIVVFFALFPDRFSFHQSNILLLFLIAWGMSLYFLLRGREKVYAIFAEMSLRARASG